MTEQDKLGKTNSQNELTRKPVNSTLEVRGDIFMLEPGPGEIPQSDQSQTAKKPLSEDQVTAREALGKLRQPDEGASLDERSSYRIFREVLVERAGFLEDELKGQEQGDVGKRDRGQELRTGSATWKNKDNDLPIKVTGYKGKGPDGRYYVSIEGSETGVPLDEVEYVLTGREKEIKQIIDSSKDFYSAFEEIIKTATPETAKDIIDNMGEAYIGFLASGLSRNSYEKHLESLKKLKESSPGEAREQLVDILRDIRDERKGLNLEDPLTHDANQEGPRLTEEEKQELERLQEDENTEQMSKKKHFNSDSIEESARRLKRLKDSLGRGESLNEKSKQHENADGRADEEVDLSANERMLHALGMIENYGKDPELDIQIMAELFGGSNNEGFLGGMVASLLPQNSPKVEQILDDFKKRLQNGEIEYVQKAILNLNDEMRKKNSDSGINSIEGLARYIVEKQNKELWGEDGEFPIIEKNGTFNQTNFFLWLRQQSAELHSDNPNGKMAPLEAVGIQNVYGSFIPIYLMTRFKEQYLRDERTGKVLTDLAEKLKYEAFMFGDWRNGSLIHRQNMGSDKELPKVEQELHSTNNLTRGRNLRFVYSLPAEFGKEDDRRLGDAIRFGNDFYSNLSDYKELEDILIGHEFTKEDFKNAIRIIKGKLDWENELGDYGNFYDSLKDRFVFKDNKGKERELFDNNGRIDMKVFCAFLNLYKSPGEPSANVELVRELVRIKMAQKYGGDIDPQTKKRAIGVGIYLSKDEKEDKEMIYDKEVLQFGESEAKRRFLLRRDAERINADYAEIWSFSAQLLFGGGADGDVRSIGANADRKVIAMQDYLLKQGHHNRGGATGIPEVMGVFKGISTNYWSGLKTESGETPYEITRQIRKIENNSNISSFDKQRLRNELIERLSFKEDAEKNFTNNNRVRAFEIFHQQSESTEAMDLGKVATWSPTEGFRLHMNAFQEQVMEKLIKPRRYAILNADVKYSQRVRRQVSLGEIDELDDLAQYDECTLAEKEFGKEVLDGINLDNPEYLDTYEGKVELFKNSIRADIAGQLRLHGEFTGIGEYWGYQRRELVIDALKTLRGLKIDKETGRITYSKNPNESFFTPTDIEWIRKNSKSEVWRMLTIDTILKGGPALAGGSWEGLMRFIQALAK